MGSWSFKGMKVEISLIPGVRSNVYKVVKDYRDQAKRPSWSENTM